MFGCVRLLCEEWMIAIVADAENKLYCFRMEAYAMPIAVLENFSLILMMGLTHTNTHFGQNGANDLRLICRSVNIARR